MTFLYLPGALIAALYFIAWFTAIPAAFAYLAIRTPQIAAYITVLFNPHPSTQPIGLAASTSRPTSLHKELARIMEKEEIDLDRANQTMRQMNGVQQLYYKVLYRRRFQEAERLRELVAERRNKMRSETNLADEFLQMEREKRGR
jgi:hypothetical protein